MTVKAKKDDSTGDYVELNSSPYTIFWASYYSQAGTTTVYGPSLTLTYTGAL